MKLLVSLIGGTVLFRTPLPLATLCIIQIMFLIDNSVYAAEKEWPYKPMKKSPLPEVKIETGPIMELIHSFCRDLKIKT